MKEDLISIGMCLREDLTGRRVGSIDDFLDLVQSQHPVIAELVRSGRVVDQSSYRNYMYDSKRIYFENGCYIIGDAAQTVDPLYSTGIATTTIQVEQVASMAKLMVHLIGVKLKLLRKAGLSRIMEHPKHLVTPLQNAAVATVMGVDLRGRSLKKSGLVLRALDFVDRQATA